MALRAAAGDLNRRIMDWRRIPVGPPVYVKLADEEALVAAWREAQSQARRQAAERPPHQAAQPPRGRVRLRWPRRPHGRFGIWRQVQVPAASTLADLHEVIQVAMGWAGMHLLKREASVRESTRSVRRPRVSRRGQTPMGSSHRGQ
jgi:hypothetical protein